MAVPLLNLALQNNSLKHEIDIAIERVCSSQQFILGPDVKEFESEASQYLGTKYALGVSSGTDALLMALMAVGVGHGDEVITTPYSFFATAGSIARLGAIPKFVDIDPVTFNIDVEKIPAVISTKTKAILPVHLFGQAADMAKLLDLSANYNIPVIEDAAQAIGSKFNNKMVGNIGKMGCFSFFPSKNLGCFGDAGLVSTNDEEVYNSLVSIRNHGMTLNERYKHQTVGGNFRIDTLQAAILRVKLPHLDSWIEKRRDNADYYRKLLHEVVPGSAFKENLILPEEIAPSFHTYNQFVIRIPFRDKFLEAAKSKEIGVMVYYPFPLHLQPCFKELGLKEGDFPQSENAALQTVALPIYPEAPKKDIEQVVELIAAEGAKNGAW